MPSFATVADLGKLLGETMAGTRADQGTIAIELASALIQGWTRQTLELVEDETITLSGTSDWELELPERPVVEVTGATIDGTAAALDSYRLSGGALVRAGGWGGPAAAVEVTYTHGYDPIPEDIRAATLQIAARMLSNPNRIRQESIGSYSVTYSEDGVIYSQLETLGRYRRRLAALPFSRVDRATRLPIGNA